MCWVPISDFVLDRARFPEIRLDGWDEAGELLVFAGYLLHIWSVIVRTGIYLSSRG